MLCCELQQFLIVNEYLQLVDITRETRKAQNSLSLFLRSLAVTDQRLFNHQQLPRLHEVSSLPADVLRTQADVPACVVRTSAGGQWVEVDSTRKPEALKVTEH